MRGILSFSELLLRSSLDPHTEEMAVLIRESARRMNALIDNLLDLARGRIGGLPIVRNADEPLEPVLMEVLSELRASHPTRAIEHEFALTEPIECDRGRIAQLVANLLSNALTYGSVTEPVRVEGRNSPNELEISVCNSGEPIPTIVAEHLFEPFYRATLRNQEGLGLGLHISHLIATAHGGTIDVSSTPKETRFVLRIPITADS
jgi:signal transduction histidine kinase